MASRAHVINDYSLGGGSTRGRRPVRFQTNDPVVLPRTRDWELNGGLIAAAVAASALVAGATYALYYTAPPQLAPTASPAISREFEPRSDWAQANALKALSGPAVASPDLSRPLMSEVPTDTAPSNAGSSPGEGNQTIINDSAPGAQDTFPQPGGDSLSQGELAPAPYPNPTTTPPDAVAPPEVSPQTPTPALDPDNPYR